MQQGSLDFNDGLGVSSKRLALSLRIYSCGHSSLHSTQARNWRTLSLADSRPGTCESSASGQEPRRIKGRGGADEPFRFPHPRGPARPCPPHIAALLSSKELLLR
jgi:hypothetical protein